MVSSCERLSQFGVQGDVASTIACSTVHVDERSWSFDRAVQFDCWVMKGVAHPPLASPWEAGLGSITPCGLRDRKPQQLSHRQSSAQAHLAGDRCAEQIPRDIRSRRSGPVPTGSTSRKSVIRRRNLYPVAFPRDRAGATENRQNHAVASNRMVLCSKQMRNRHSLLGLTRVETRRDFRYLGVSLPPFDDWLGNCSVKFASITFPRIGNRQHGIRKWSCSRKQTNSHLR